MMCEKRTTADLPEDFGSSPFHGEILAAAFCYCFHFDTKQYYKI